jgi:hypothetical protein
VTADAQLQLAEVELVDVDDVQLVAIDVTTGMGEAQAAVPILAPMGERYLAAEAIGSRGRRPPVRGVSTRRSTARSRRGWLLSWAALRWSEISMPM